MADWQRFYLGYKERFVEDCCITLRKGITVRVRQAPSAKKATPTEGIDKDSDPALTGTTVWDGAVALSHYLAAPGLLRQQVQLAAGRSSPIVSLELGAGTGLVSLSLLAAGAVDAAIITDIPDMLPHMSSNVQYNSNVIRTSTALVRSLRWGQPEDVAALAPHHPPFDIILGADLVYYSYTPKTPHSRLLYQALQQLAGPQTLIYLSLSLHHNSEEVEHFLAWAPTWGFSVERLTQQLPQEYQVPDVLVVRLRLEDGEKAAAAAAAARDGSLQRPYTDE
jgi:predicted nicotinamide N-methyase